MRPDLAANYEFMNCQRRASVAGSVLTSNSGCKWKIAGEHSAVSAQHSALSIQSNQGNFRRYADFPLQVGILCMGECGVVLQRTGRASLRHWVFRYTDHLISATAASQRLAKKSTHKTLEAVFFDLSKGALKGHGINLRSSLGGIYFDSVNKGKIYSIPLYKL